MKILSFNTDINSKKQIVVMTTTMHILNTKEKGEKALKKFPAAVSKEWKLLNEKGFSIQYPSNWTLDKTGQIGSEFVLYSKNIPEFSPFRENINLMVQDLSKQKINLDKFVEVTENQVKTMVTNSQILESERISIDNTELHRTVFTGTTQNMQLKFIQVYCVRNNKAYILTYTCETCEFDKLKKTAEKIMNSFKLD